MTCTHRWFHWKSSHAIKFLEFSKGTNRVLHIEMGTEQQVKNEIRQNAHIKQTEIRDCGALSDAKKCKL